MNKRRVGLVSWLGDALIMLGLRYDSDAGRQMAAKMTEVMRDGAYLASVELAQEKGKFPLFDADKHLSGEHSQSSAGKDQAKIRKHGMRNSHLTSIAPPAPSAWRLLTMPRMASNRRSPGITTAINGWPTAVRRAIGSSRLPRLSGAGRQ